MISRLLLLILLVFPCIPAQGQIRFGAESGAILDYQTNDWNNADELSIHGMAVGIRGEYTIDSRASVYISPLLVIAKGIERVEIPIGGRLRLTDAFVNPYVSLALAATYRAPNEYTNFTWPDELGGNYPESNFKYQDFDAMAVAGFGVEFGGAARPSFYLEARYHRGLVSIADDRDYSSVYTRNVSILAGFYF